MAEVTRKVWAEAPKAYRGWLPRYLERKPLVTLERGRVFGGILFPSMQVKVLPSAIPLGGGIWQRSVE